MKIFKFLISDNRKIEKIPNEQKTTEISEKIPDMFQKIVFRDINFWKLVFWKLVYCYKIFRNSH